MKVERLHPSASASVSVGGLPRRPLVGAAIQISAILVACIVGLVSVSGYLRAAGPDPNQQSTPAEGQAGRRPSERESPKPVQLEPPPRRGAGSRPWDLGEFFQMEDPLEAARALREHARRHKIPLNERSPASPRAEGNGGQAAAPGTKTPEALVHVFNGTEFIPAPGLEAGLSQRVASLAPEAKEGLVVCLLEFQGAMSMGEVIEMLEARVKVYDRAGPQTLIVRLPASSVAFLATRPYVRWLGEYKPEYKYAAVPVESSRPSARIYPLGGDRPEYRADLQGLGIKLRSYDATVGCYDVDLDVSRFPQVAQLWWVKGVDKDLDQVPLANGLNFEPDDSRQLICGFDTVEVGEGVPVGVWDTGIWNGNALDFPPGSYVSLGGYADSNGHGTHVSGIIAARGARDIEGDYDARGMAPAATLYVASGVAGTGGGYTLSQAFAFFNNNAVKVSNHSWGYTGAASYVYDSNTAAMDAYVDNEDHVIVVAAGNDYDPRTVGNPATGKNVLSVGSILYVTNDAYSGRNIGRRADYSSQGPTNDDSRLAPVMVAPGGETYEGYGYYKFGVVSCNNASSNDDGSDIWPTSDWYTRMSGTSMAAPHVTGLCAKVQGWDNTIHSELLKALVINTTIPTRENSIYPLAGYASTEVGYGMANAFSITDHYAGESERLLFGEDWVNEDDLQDDWTVTVPTGVRQLAVTLAYNDEEGETRNNKALIDDVDLILVAPDATTYRADEHLAGGVTTESPLEKMVIVDPAEGDWTVRVVFTDSPDFSNPTRYAEQRYGVVAHAIFKVPELTLTAPATVNVIPYQPFTLQPTVENTGGYIAAGVTVKVAGSASFGGQVNQTIFTRNLLCQGDSVSPEIQLTGPAAPGTYDLTVEADGVNREFTSGYPRTATVTVVVALPENPLQITSASPLPSGLATVPYSADLEASGGTTPFVWSVLASAANYTESDPGSGWLGAGTAKGWRGDDASWSLTLPWTFPYYDTGYTSVWVCSNGYLDFASSAVDFSPDEAELAANARIAPLWDDLRTDGSGDDIFVTGTPDYVAIRWRGRTYWDDHPVNVEAVLYRSGDIKFNYGAAHTGLYPVIGVSKGDGTHYTLSTRNGAYSIPAYVSSLFSLTNRFPPGLSLDSATGAITGTPTGTATYTFTVQVQDASPIQQTNRKDFALTIDAPPVLTVAVPVSASETAGVLSGQGSVNISSAPASDLAVNLASDDTSELTVPGSVTIPAGLTSTTFNLTLVDDGEIDGTKTVTVTASATGCISGSDSIQVLDNESKALSVSLPVSATEGDGVLVGQGSVSIPGTYASNVVVTVTSNDTTEVTVPSPVTITAGLTSATFDVTIVDDAIADGPQTATITASAASWTSGTDSISVLDNEHPALGLTTISFATEGDGVRWSAGSVSLPDVQASDLVVTLTSDDTTEVTVPPTVTIPAGMMYMDFDVTIVDDTEIDGTDSATITASATGWTSATSTITVDDNETQALSLAVPATAREGDGVLANQGTVSIPGTYPSDLVVSLGSNDTSEVTVPASVTISTGATSATFDLTVVDDSVIDGSQTATISASAAGWTSANDSITIQDNDVLSIVTNVSAVTVPEGATASFQVKLSHQPASGVTVTVSRASGDTDITVSAGSSLSFTTGNWDTYQPVTLAAAEDVDVADGAAVIRCHSASVAADKDVTATEDDNDTLTFVTDQSVVFVAEGGSAQFQVKLSNEPASTVTVTVGRVGGDEDITVSAGSSLTFGTSDWDLYQAVTLAAAEDADMTAGAATIRCQAVGLTAVDVSAREEDNDALLVDDGGTGYSDSGDWSPGSMVGGYGGDYRYHAAGDGSGWARWEVSDLPAGTYRLYTTWMVYPGARTTAAPFEVFDGDSSLGTVLLDQTAPAADIQAFGQRWKSLGNFHVESGRLVVQLTDDADNFVIADALYVTTPPEPPLTVDDGDEGYQQAGTWLTGGMAGGYQRDYAYCAPGDGSGWAQWQLTGLASGSYEVYVTYVPNRFYRASDARYEVFDGSTSLGAARLDQTRSPDDGEREGHEWEYLGTFHVASETLRVRLTNDADNYVVADAIYVAPAAEGTRIADDGGVGYQEEGVWLSGGMAGGYKDDYRYCSAGSGSRWASWTFAGLPAGAYRVYTTYVANRLYRATNAPYEILDGSTSLEVVRLNQTRPPDDATYDGHGWEALGTYQVASGSLTVRLTDDAGNFVIADAVCVVAVPGLPLALDDGDPEYGESGSWALGGMAGAYEGDYVYHAAGDGSAWAQWSLPGLPVGTYEVYATYVANKLYRATNAPYEVLDGSTSLGVVRLNQTRAPDDTTSDSHSWEHLGTYDIASGTLTVRLTNDANNYVIADAVYITPVGGGLPASAGGAGPLGLSAFSGGALDAALAFGLSSTSAAAPGGAEGPAAPSTQQGPTTVTVSGTGAAQAAAAEDPGGPAGSGTDTAASPPDDRTAPTAVITHPVASEGPLSESLVTVEGTAQDESAIKTLWVNGVRATATGPNYSTWQAQVPLSQGRTQADPSAANLLVVSALDESGNYDPVAANETVLSVGAAGLVRRVTLDTRCLGSLAPGDVDSFQFEAIAGTRLWLTVRRYGRSPDFGELSRAVDFALELYDPAGKFLDVPEELAEVSETSVAVNGWSLPATGLYTVRLLHQGGDGMYVLRLRGEVPAPIETVVGELSPSGEATHAVTALRGSVLTLQVRTEGWQPQVGLRDPCGRAVPLPASAETSPGLLVVREVQLPDTGEPYETGTYEVVVAGREPSSSGRYRLTWSLHPPTPEPLTLEEALLLEAEPVGAQLAGTAGEPPSPSGASLRLRVAGMGDGGAVFLGDVPLTVVATELRGGRGTIAAALPKAPLPTPAAVHITCAGEQSNSLPISPAP